MKWSLSTKSLILDHITIIIIIIANVYVLENIILLKAKK